MSRTPTPTSGALSADRERQPAREGEESTTETVQIVVAPGRSVVHQVQTGVTIVDGVEKPVMSHRTAGPGETITVSKSDARHLARGGFVFDVQVPIPPLPPDPGDGGEGGEGGGGEEIIEEGAGRRRGARPTVNGDDGSVVKAR